MDCFLWGCTKNFPAEYTRSLNSSVSCRDDTHAYSQHNFVYFKIRSQESIPAAAFGLLKLMQINFVRYLPVSRLHYIPLGLC
jgi:hypothetical protein